MAFAILRVGVSVGVGATVGVRIRVSVRGSFSDGGTVSVRIRDGISWFLASLSHSRSTWATNPRQHWLAHGLHPSTLTTLPSDLHRYIGYDLTLDWVLAKWTDLPLHYLMDADTLQRFRAMIDLVTSKYFQEHSYQLFIELVSTVISLLFVCGYAVALSSLSASNSTSNSTAVLALPCVANLGPMQHFGRWGGDEGVRVPMRARFRQPHSWQ